MFSAFDCHARCWSPPEVSPLFPNLSIKHRTQIGGTCVFTGLSLLTEEKPEEIRKKVNTQDSINWSRYTSDRLNFALNCKMQHVFLRKARKGRKIFPLADRKLIPAENYDIKLSG